AVVYGRLEPGGVAQWREAVFILLGLQLGGAPLFRLRPAVELLVHLVDAPLGVRVFGLPGLLRRLVALEEAAQLGRDALLLARPALRLIDLSRVDLLDERPDAAVHDG